MSLFLPHNNNNNKTLFFSMAISLPHVKHFQHLSSTSTSTSLKTPPPNLSLPSQNPNSLTPLADIYKPRTLKQAFLAVSNSSPQTPPSQQEYSSVLELCASQKALFQGKQIHARIMKSGSLDDDGFLATKLSFMYGKCGVLLDAQHLFDEMPHRTIFAWNALVGGYVSNGQFGSAVELYKSMRVLEVAPDACTFASALKACAAVGDLYCGAEIHGVAVKRGVDSITFVANALVGMYAKCGQFDLAMRLFDRLHDGKDVVSWNSIISACVQNGQFLKALILFREMLKADIMMNSYTAVGVLQVCAELSLVKLGMEIHASLVKHKHEFEIYEANALVVMYSKCGRMEDAIKAFEEMGERDNVSWNSMLSGYVQNGFYDEAIRFFHEMLDFGFIPDQVSIISIASSLGRLGKLRSGQEVHAYTIKQGFDSDLQVGNTLMDMYTKCCFLNYADRVFNKMPNKDYISWTTVIAAYAQNSCYFDAFELFREVTEKGMKIDALMIGSILQACGGLRSLPLLKQIHGYTIRHGLLDLVLENTIIDVYGECGQIDHSFRVFERIENKDIVTWTCMITCYTCNGFLKEALELFLKMGEANVEPDSVALVSILAAAAGLSSLMKGKEIHAFLIRRNFNLGGSLVNSLVDMYAQCGDIENSYKLFNGVECKDLVLWTAMINASGMNGRGLEAIDLFRSMQNTGLIPDQVTFLALLYACSHSRLIDEGKLFFGMMTNKYKLDPWPEHYVCMVDLLSRSGNIDGAYEFIKSMPIEPTSAVWCALLGACRIYKNHELGEIAAEKLLELEPENPGNYVLISNVYAAMGKWKDAKEVRSRMNARCLKKDPACSWIEVGEKVHIFTARDNSHENSVEIYSKLAEMTQRLEKEGGYVEDTSSILHDVEDEEKIKMLHGHSERLAIAFGLIPTSKGSIIRITKNLRVCGDCHEFTKLVSRFFGREIIVRDANRFHHFKDGSCSCRDFW